MPRLPNKVVLAYGILQRNYRVSSIKHNSNTILVSSGIEEIMVSSQLHNVVFGRSLPEMCAARHDMVEIARGCAAHTVFALLVAQQVFCRCGGLS